MSKFISYFDVVQLGKHLKFNFPQGIPSQINSSNSCHWAERPASNIRYTIVAHVQTSLTNKTFFKQLIKKNINKSWNWADYLKKRIPLKLLASNRCILLWDKCRTFKTALRANVPRDSSVSALFDTLHQPSFVRSAICWASSFFNLLKLISKTSSSRKFLNWFRFRLSRALPCRSRVLSLRKGFTNVQITCNKFSFILRNLGISYLKQINWNITKWPIC